MYDLKIKNLLFFCVNIFKFLKYTYLTLKFTVFNFCMMIYKIMAKLQIKKYYAI